MWIGRRESRKRNEQRESVRERGAMRARNEDDRETSEQDCDWEDAGSKGTRVQQYLACRPSQKQSRGCPAVRAGYQNPV